MTIRPATIDDYDGVNRVSAGIADVHAAALPERFRSIPAPVSLDHFRSLLDSPRHEVLVAELNGRILGWEKLELREAPPVPMVVPRTYVLIDEIGVLATEQGQGIGRRLVDAAVAWARAKGASGIELQVYEFNEGAIAFYEHVGFCTIRRAMALPVEPA